MKTKISELNPFNSGRLEHAFVWETIKEFYSKYNKNIKCLDYGGYDGMLMEELIKSNFTKNGVTVDLNLDIINKFKNTVSKYHQMIGIKKGKPLPFKKESFDVITIIGVIEHVHNQKYLLNEIYRILKPNGLIIIAVPGKHLFSFLDFA